MQAPLIALFDVDNTLYPRSSGLGKAMGDRIVQWMREHIDVSKIDASSLPPAKEVDSSYNHPPDIEAKDELIERLALSHYLKYGLTIVGLVKHQGVSPKQEEECECLILFPRKSPEFFFFLDLACVHQPSAELEKFMPHAQEHVNTVKLFEQLKQDKIGMFLFSNAPGSVGCFCAAVC